MMETVRQANTGQWSAARKARKDTVLGADNTEGEGTENAWRHLSEKREQKIE